MFPQLLHTAGHETPGALVTLSFSQGYALPSQGLQAPTGACLLYDLQEPDEEGGEAELRNLESAWAPTQRMSL